MNPNVRLASKTVEAIDAAIKADQGNKFRHWLKQTLPHIADIYRQEESDDERSHLGASVVGKECSRAIWYGWRWFTNKQFDGRIIRLFNRGHMEEARFISCLLTIGVKVFQQGSDGQQFRISHAGGHFGGSPDGVGMNIPDLSPEQAALLEFKTHGEKSFTSLKTDGVRESKPEHYTQMQVYMRKMALAVGLYLAVNKNTDELYGEIITLNPEHADQYLTRGEIIVFMPTPPPRISETPGFYKCRMCDDRAVCHKLTGGTPQFNCRTCQHSTPLQSGEWYCNMQAKVLSKEEQIKGCSSYSPIT